MSWGWMRKAYFLYIHRIGSQLRCIADKGNYTKDSELKRFLRSRVRYYTEHGYHGSLKETEKLLKWIESNDLLDL